MPDFLDPDDMDPALVRYCDLLAQRARSMGCVCVPGPVVGIDPARRIATVEHFPGCIAYEHPASTPANN